MGKPVGGFTIHRGGQHAHADRPGRVRDLRGRPVDPVLGGVFYASGHDGQYVWIDRANRIVVVRLGVSGPGLNPPRLAAAVLKALVED